MKIDKDTIKHIADLAMIEIDKDEEEKYAKSLEQILTYAEILNSINLEDSADFIDSYPKETNKMRKDEVKNSISREKLLQNAPAVQEDMFQIPKTFEQ